MLLNMHNNAALRYIKIKLITTQISCVVAVFFCFQLEAKCKN